MHLALYQPDIAGNVGAMLRTAACFNATVHIIEPAGFTWDQSTLRRAAMDYARSADVVRHRDVEHFLAAMHHARARVILMSSQGTMAHHAFAWRSDDVILMGSESAGVPDAVVARCSASVRIAIMAGLRSLNVSVAAGIALSEARRQQGWTGTEGR